MEKQLYRRKAPSKRLQSARTLRRWAFPPDLLAVIRGTRVAGSLGLALCLLAGMLAGCTANRTPSAAGQTPSVVEGSVTPEARQNDSTPPGSIPTAPAAVLEQPLATQTPRPALEPTRAGLVRPPSGWTIFSNPDFVRGIVVHGGLIWAATGGGVVTWDLKTSLPALITTRDGLAEIEGSDIVFCSLPRERMIVAHPSGMLSVYDLALKKWTRMSITFSDGGTLHGVSTLLCDSPNRRLLVGASDGLGILDEKTGVWRKIGSKEGLKTDTISGIAVVGQSIWIAAKNKSAFMIMGSTVFPFNSASGFPSGAVNDLSVAPDASIWFGYSTGLVHYQEKKWNSYGGQTPAGIPFLSVDHVEVGADKRIWIASAEEGVCPFDVVKLFCATVYPGVRGSPITDLVVGADGTAYAATDGAGVLVLGSDQVQQLAFKRQQLVSNDILDMAQDSAGKLWVATDHGVNVFDPRQPEEAWQLIKPQRNQLPFSRVSGLLPAANGMWFTYDQEPQATFFDGETWFQLDASKGMSGMILDAQVDQRGYVWFATDEGIKVWDGALLRTYTPLQDLPGNVFQALYADGDGMWVGTQRGLLRYERFQWRLMLPETPIYAITADLDGGLLLGTDRGLVRFDGSQSYLWIFNMGREVIADSKVTSITWDGAGGLWVGTEENGLFQYDGKKWEQFNTSNGLPTDHVRKLLTDRLGEVWMITTTGEGGGALTRYMP